jgi:hexosaminidase
MIHQPLLWPAPQKIQLLPGQFRVDALYSISVINTNPDEILLPIKNLQETILKRTQKTWTMQACQSINSNESGLTLRVIPEIFTRSQSYKLKIQPEFISLIGSDTAGVSYGICTLIQIFQQFTEQLPCLEIFDYPDYPVRGVMLDISRDRVPTMDTLYGLVDLLASWKINQLQLYTEHTFAFSQHKSVWQNASPMTAEEVMLLDKYCCERFVELVPNQNSFGHMYRWLKHPEYGHLAEVHGWFESPWGEMEGPFSLCPLLPGSLDLLTGLYDELLPNFRSRLFNVGCDETVDLGKGKSKLACEDRGTGQVYLDFLLKIHHEVNKRNHVMQFWGDIILQHPDLIPKIPENVIALEWGYEADHPFDEHGRQFAESGIPFYVCPGTSSWNSIAGRTDNALQNLKTAAEIGLVNGAMGYLITDWGDNGHWQQLPISYLGFMAGAGYSWAFQANQSSDIKKALSLFAFRDSSGAAGHLVYSLGNLYKDIGPTVHNSSLLFRVLQTSITDVASDPNLNNYRVDNVKEDIQHSRKILSMCKFLLNDGKQIADELLVTTNLLEHACNRLKFASGQGHKEKLLRDLDEITSEFERLWHLRSRIGGLADSISRFKNIRDDYLGN